MWCAPHIGSLSVPVKDAQRAEEIALERYKAGLVGDLDVVYAEQTVLTDEQTEAQISGQRLVASVALIKALGGGWKGQPHS
jgi:multidrug efflux system outer membrane protein